jgi:peptidoglycan/xylan/chitin deacetylase (PgdA/CDA1 family)
MNILPSIIVPILSGIVGSLSAGRHSRKTTIPGLLFHSIVSKPGLNLSQCSVKTFKNFLKILREQNYETVIISKAATKELNQSPQHKKILITFDDGLDTVSNYATQFLDEYDFKSTVFCVSGFIGKSSTWDVYKESTHMGAVDIRKISDSGHEIGSHTQTHANLPYLNQNDLVRELRDSKKNLEDIIGKEVKSISFPHGCWNKRVWETALELGYLYASLYRGHSRASCNQFPVISANCFDTANSLMDKINLRAIFSPTIAFSRIASHFGKGTPLWKFRENYDVTR